MRWEVMRAFLDVTGPASRRAPRTMSFVSVVNKDNDRIDLCNIRNKSWRGSRGEAARDLSVKLISRSDNYISVTPPARPHCQGGRRAEGMHPPATSVRDPRTAQL